MSAGMPRHFRNGENFTKWSQQLWEWRWLHPEPAEASLEVGGRTRSPGHRVQPCPLLKVRGSPLKCPGKTGGQPDLETVHSCHSQHDTSGGNVRRGTQRNTAAKNGPGVQAQAQAELFWMGRMRRYSLHGEVNPLSEVCDHHTLRLFPKVPVVFQHIVCLHAYT